MLKMLLKGYIDLEFCERVAMPTDVKCGKQKRRERRRKSRI